MKFRALLPFLALVLGLPGLLAALTNEERHGILEIAQGWVDRHNDQLDDMVSTTSRVFLGLTLGCSRCHNHKFDPLTLHDYYRMVAIFDPLKRPQDGRTELDRPAGSRAECESLAERNQRVSVSFCCV